MIKVLIGDDHPVVREGLKLTLLEASDIQVVGEASNAQEVLEEVWKEQYDLLLLDISLPGRSGIEVLKQLKAEKSQLPVLILTVHPESQYAVRAFQAGASGYLTKESLPEELVTAIRTVSSGRKYVSSTLAEAIADHLDFADQRPLHTRLSDREYDVMRGIASGKTVTQIADQISLSVKTISTYRTRLLEKMNMSTNAEIIRYAIQNGLVD